MKIIPYDSRYKQDFIDLNKAWITGLFGFMEQKDIETFQNAEKTSQKAA